MTEPQTTSPSHRAPDDRSHRQLRLPSWRWEALRTTFWVVPTVLIVVACILFVITYELDLAAFHHHLTLPWWVRTGSADAGRQVLIAIAAAIITTVGVVFSITILALTLASQQFGPRMMRNFVRDLGNQMTLGVFVATFVYSVLALGSITGLPSGDFVPHLSITVAEGFLLLDLGVLIYFIHHIAKSIQLPEVIAGIARDLNRAIEAEFPEHQRARDQSADGSSAVTAELIEKLSSRGAEVTAKHSGYLQFVGFSQLIDIAETLDAVIRLAHRPGHFVVANRRLATVWPAGAAGQVAAALDKAHVTGPHRTLTQDPVFAIDQLVEIAIRALSPAVNDTFTALTCIDWLSGGLSEISARVLEEGAYRGRSGKVRLIEFDPSYERMVNRAFDKVRQAGRGMPAVIIRMIDALTHITENTTSSRQRAVLLRQAEMIMRGAEEEVPEQNDLADIRVRFDKLAQTSAAMDHTSGSALGAQV
ncbi:MAG: DUF2254 domain-containing protein [Acidimicrobiales bacterium]